MSRSVLNPGAYTKATQGEIVAYSVTACHTQSSLRSLWTKGLRERDLEKELFELNLKIKEE